MTGDQHRSLRQLVGAHVLGQLDQPEGVRLRAHLNGCAACQAEVSELAPLAEPLRAVDVTRLQVEAAPARDLGERVIAQIRQHRQVARRLRRRRIAATAVFAAAAVAAVFLLGAATGPFGRDWSREVAGPPVENLIVQIVGAGVSAEAGVVTHTWGTELRLVARGLESGGTYAVAFVRDDGSRISAGTFLGTGLEEVRCSLNAALPRVEAERMVVTDRAGSVVVQGDLPR